MSMICSAVLTQYRSVTDEQTDGVANIAHFISEIMCVRFIRLSFDCLTLSLYVHACSVTVAW